MHGAGSGRHRFQSHLIGDLHAPDDVGRTITGMRMFLGRSAAPYAAKCGRRTRRTLASGWSTSQTGLRQSDPAGRWAVCSDLRLAG